MIKTIIDVIILFLLSLFSSCGFNQNTCTLENLPFDSISNVAVMQGVHIPFRLGQDSSSVTYIITHGYRQLSVNLHGNELYEINEGIFGFAEEPLDWPLDELTICDLKPTGTTFIEALEPKSKDEGVLQSVFFWNGVYAETGSLDFTEEPLYYWEKVSHLPYYVYAHILAQQKTIELDLVSKYSIYEKLMFLEVSSERAYFYNSPTEEQHRRAFVVKGDVVIVDDSQPGWLKVAYEGETVTTQGWVKAKYLKRVD